MKYILMLGLLVGCIEQKIQEAATYQPKFKVGDCLKYTYFPSKEVNEFLPEDKKPTVIYTKVEKVGKINYLLRYGPSTLGESSIEFVDQAEVKVSCEEANKEFE